MTSSPEAFGSTIARLRRQVEERARWEAEHPEEAAKKRAEEAAAEAAELKAARRWEIGAIPDVLGKVGVPLRLGEAVRDEAFADFEGRPRVFWDTDAMVAARAFVASKKSFLVLFGGVGSGKSAAAAWTLAGKGSAGFVRAAKLARISKFEDGGEWEDALRVRWLVIDDLGTESVSDYWFERVNELLDSRYGDRLRTVITSNLSKEEIKTKYGDRIASRIRDDGMVVGCGSDDLRAAKKDTKGFTPGAPVDVYRIQEIQAKAAVRGDK